MPTIIAPQNRGLAGGGFNRPRPIFGPSGSAPVFTSPTAAGSDAGPGGHWSNPSLPDYGALIQNDPGLIMTRDWSAASSVADAAARRSFIRNALTNFGTIPQGLQDKYGDIDSKTRQAALENPYSVQKGLQKTFENAVSSMEAALGARGLAASGQVGFENRNLVQQRGQADYEARQNLLNAISGANSSFASSELQRQQALAQAMLAASGNVAGLYPAQQPDWIEDTPAPPGSSTATPGYSPTFAAPAAWAARAALARRPGPQNRGILGGRY